MKILKASSLAAVAWSACNNVGNNGANRYALNLVRWFKIDFSGFHVKTDWPAGDATGFEGLITVPIRRVLEFIVLLTDAIIRLHAH